MTNQVQLDTRATGTTVKLAATLTAALLYLKSAGAFLVKGGWLVKTGLTTLLSFGVYGMAYGWRFAVALIGMLIIHEFGHWIWLKANGVPAEVPIFIPFVGAIISLKKLPRNSITTAWTGLAGPLVGGAGALACYMLGYYTNNGPLMAGGSFGFLLNLFQLVPAMPLDGGWALAGVSRLFLIPGTIILIFLAIMTASPLMAIVSIVAVCSLFSKAQDEPESAPQVEETPPVKSIGELEQAIIAPPVKNEVTPSITQEKDKKEKKARKPFKFEPDRAAIFVAYIILTGLLAFMSVESIAVLNEKLNVSSPAAYLKH